MRLQEDAVDVVDVDGFVGTADRFDQAADAEVFGSAQHAVGGANDQVDRGLGEGVVSQSDAVEFAEDEFAQGVGVQAFGDHRICVPSEILIAFFAEFTLNGFWLSEGPIAELLRILKRNIGGGAKCMSAPVTWRDALQ